MGGWKRGVEENNDVNETHNKGSLGNPSDWVPSGLVSDAEGKEHRNGQYFIHKL